MLTVPQLNLGSIDAVNYKTKEDKEFFAKILFREDYLGQVLERKKYFLIGEKGTGKTSYSVFLHNSDYQETLSRTVSLTQTDYRRFISMTDQGKFGVSSYVDIWKVILLLLVSDGIANRFADNAFAFQKFKNLKQAIDEYYHSAFRPEVDQSLDMIENSEIAAKLITKYTELGAKDGVTIQANFPSFQVNLAYLERQFKIALSSVKLPKDFILFIDGIDIRPDQIEYPKYIECIRGLANAAWDLNTEYFANIKDSRKHIKVMLLMRPDILDNMGFQNLNAKVHDNGVLLDWTTSYDAFKNSALFHLVAGTLAKQQDVKGSSDWEVWKHYFPYDHDNLRIAEKADDPFVNFLRYSFYRPRDIVRYLQLMQDSVKRNEVDKSVFSKESFFDCQRNFSEYLLGEVKDYLSFYYSNVDFDEIAGFFSEFGGNNTFSWRQFQNAFERRKTQLSGIDFTLDNAPASPEAFLQFLYSINIIGYLEPDDGGGHFVHYCFRDRTTAKLRPKARTGLQYSVHPGLQRALLVGGKNRTRHRRGRKRH